MNNLRKILGIAFLLILQSCYFGGGLVEKEITNGYWLFANNELDEMSIWFSPEKDSNQLIVPQTVFALGENGDFIIAKSHPKNVKRGIDKSITYYYIIKVGEKSTEQSLNLTLEQFESKRKELNVPNSLDFDIVYEELK